MSGANLPVLAAAALVSIFALVPLLFVAWTTVQTGWETALSLIIRPRVGELLVNTLSLELVAIPLAIVVAVSLAWLTERTDLIGARIWAWLAVTPLAIPAFVHSYAWVSLVPGLHGLSAAVLVSVLAYFPFVYLPVAAQLRRLDPSLEDASASLGFGRWLTFVRVVLPQLRLAICGGSLLIGLHLLGEYGLFAMLRFDTFTTAIVDQFQSTYNGLAANMLAGVLVLSCLGLLVLEAMLRGKERYARVGSGAAPMMIRCPLGRLMPLGLFLILLVTALSLGVPMLTLGRWLGIGGLDVWRGAVGGALLQTLAYALAGGLLATIAAAPMAWLSVRSPSPLQRILEACQYYVGSLPGVVIALALATLTITFAMPLYQTSLTLLMAYLLLFLPRALVSLRASLALAPVELEQAAMALGRTPLQAICQVTMRLTAPGAAASMALVGLGVTNELTATLLLSPSGTYTLATEFWALTAEIDYVSAAPYALLMILLSLPMTLILHAQSKWATGR
ncbi:iron(III) transport system permease protein [Rhodoligotrophos appendicifer]|uniref:ABC transporter permease n=1 Tax=Rhodoligotrophos appendicifer TaxID=987056 RepID=UPI001478D17F|nr:iron ABC transporter permease [Rhodoligotrophos appendicifer]